MSELSISAATPLTISLENQATGVDAIKDNSSTILSGVNPSGVDANDQSIAGVETASRSTEFIGAGTDFSSTGTDIDIAQAISSSLTQATGTIADKIA